MKGSAGAGRKWTILAHGAFTALAVTAGLFPLDEQSALGDGHWSLEETARAQATALPEQWAPPTRAEVADQRMGVAMDGTIMNYLEMREEEWPIGSGMVERGGKQYKARFCGPGMRWSRAGAEKLLPVRSVILSKRFDELWARVYRAPQA